MISEGIAVKKCKKTTSGRHIWKALSYFTSDWEQIEAVNKFKIDFPLKKCLACKMIDY
jgi:hypothetical protein